MGSNDWPVMEVIRLAKDDPEASRLLDEFFDACFASVPSPAWAPRQTLPAAGSADRIAGALGALNARVRRQNPGSDGLSPPAAMSLEEWAEDLAIQFLTNSPS